MKKQIVILSCLLLSISLNLFAEEHQVNFESAMGNSRLNILVVSSKDSSKALEQELKELITGYATLYNEIFNAQADINRLKKNEEYSLKGYIFELISKGISLSQLTEGWYDIVSNKKSQFAFTAKDWRRVELDSNNRSIKFKASEMTIDLNLLAMSFIVDMLSDELKQRGFTNHRVCIDNTICRNSGRDIYTRWTYDLRISGGEYAKKANQYQISDLAFTEIRVDGLGDKLIDPKTGEKVLEKLINVTVFANDAMTSTALAIATYAIGPKGALAFIRKYPNIKAIVITPQKGEVVTSLGMEFSKPNYDEDVKIIQNVVDRGPNEIKGEEK